MNKFNRLLKKGLFQVTPLEPKRNLFITLASKIKVVRCVSVKFHVWKNFTTHFTLLCSIFLRVAAKKRPPFLDFTNSPTLSNPLQLVPRE